MERTLTLEQLAHYTGEEPDELRRWVDLRLIGADSPGSFGPEDIERAALVRLFLLRGIGLEDIARSFLQGDLKRILPRYLDMMFPGDGHPAFTLQEAADRVGLDPEQARRLWESMRTGRQSDVVNEDDIDALRIMKRALQAGLPEEALLQMSRTWTESLGRAAEVASRLVHFYMHEQPASDGPAPIATIQEDLLPLLEPMILYYLRRGVARSVPGDMLLHLEWEIGRRQAGPVPGRLPLAILFIDLSSFTPLAEAMGDAKAAEVLDRFSTFVRAGTNRHTGQIVKQIGDGFMIVFNSVSDAVGFALELETATMREPQFPACRTGVHWGEALYRDGDYIGAAVNLAARVAASAARHQILITGAARREVGEMAQIVMRPLGATPLKGVTDAVEIFAVHPAASQDVAKVVDPVCGMELGAGEAAASITMGGKEFSFCSQMCLRRFVGASERYGARSLV